MKEDAKRIWQGGPSTNILMDSANKKTGNSSSKKSTKKKKKKALSSLEVEEIQQQ
jgi:hypothetical protein